MIIKIMRSFLGVLFMFTGILKFVDLSTFQESIHKFHIIENPGILLFAALFIPAAEIVAGLALMMGVFKKTALYLLTVLMIIFTLAISNSLIKGITFDCSCFGIFQKYLSPEMSWWSVILNLWIISALVFILLKNKSTSELSKNYIIPMVFTIFLMMLGSIQLNNKLQINAIYAANITDISFTRALELVKTNGATLIDARQKAKYDQEHVPGAILLPYEQEDAYFQNVENLDRRKEIVVYCDNEI